MNKHICIALLAAGILLAATQVRAQTTVSMTPTQFGAANPNDPNTWPATFDGLNAMGPYAWVDGPAHLQQDPQLAGGVFAGQEGAIRIFVCRAKMDDGVHPGKFFNGQCNVGWGGEEKVLAAGYELLVNTQPQHASFLPQTWGSPAAGGGVQGGAVGTAGLRVCRAPYNGGVHPGKEWAGACFIAWGGQEVPVSPYEILTLSFDKAGWQAAQATATASPTLSFGPNLNTWLTAFDGVNSMGPYVWMNAAAVDQNQQHRANVVRATPEGGRLLCRARMADGGIYPGSVSWSTCDIGWNGKEVKVSPEQGYEVLVNTEPFYRKFLTQTWSSPGAADPGSTFKGGSLGGAPVRVARQAGSDKPKIGWEREGKGVVSGYGQEMPFDNYEVLTLGFDKAAWQAAGSPIYAVDPNMTLPTPPSLFVPQPVEVKITKRLQNVFVMESGTNTCIAADLRDYAANLQPGAARSLSREGLRLRTCNFVPLASQPEITSCVNELPGAWFVREDLPQQPGWFRLKWLDTNLCVDAASADDGAAVSLATCNGSVNQGWSVDGTRLVSALTSDNNTLEVLLDQTKKFFLVVQGQAASVSSASYAILKFHQFPMWLYYDNEIGGKPE